MQLDYSKGMGIAKKACFFTALGGLLFGLDQGFINGSLQYIQKEFNFTTSQAESFASIMLIGCIFGVLSSGWFSRHLGRKYTLIGAALFFALFTLLGAVTSNTAILFTTRFCLGLAVGCASFVVPLYLSEIAPKKIRGTFITMYQFMITLGIFLIFVSNSVIGKYFQSWRLMLGIIAIPSFVMLLGVIRVPQSPRWLVLKERDKEAKDVLNMTRTSSEEAAMEYEEIRQSIEDSKKQKTFEMLKKPYFIKVILLGMALHSLAQLSGINAMIYYSGHIFETAGFSNQSVATVVIGLVNMFSTIIAIKYFDKLGRKPVCYIGLIMLLVTIILCGALFKMQENGVVLGSFMKMVFLVSCIVYIFAFAFSICPFIWVICAEIFPLEGRDFGMTITTATNWIFNTIVVRFSLSVIQNYGGSTLFFLFAVFCFLFLVIFYFFVPETTGVSLEHIELNLKKGRKLKQIGKSHS